MTEVFVTDSELPLMSYPVDKLFEQLDLASRAQQDLSLL